MTPAGNHNIQIISYNDLLLQPSPLKTIIPRVYIVEYAVDVPLMQRSASQYNALRKREVHLPVRGNLNAAAKDGRPDNSFLQSKWLYYPRVVFIFQSELTVSAQGGVLMYP